jgi:hypothetical protein
MPKDWLPVFFFFMSLFLVAYIYELAATLWATVFEIGQTKKEKRRC